MGLYDVVRERQRRRFNPLWVVLLVLCLVALLLMGMYISKPQREHERFIECMGELSEGTTQSYPGRFVLLRAELDGQELAIIEENAYELYSKLFYMIPLRFTDSLPQEEGAYLEYGNGTVLRLWPYALKEGEGVRSEGIFVCLTTAEGESYSYYTDGGTFREVKECLSPEKNAPWEGVVPMW